MDRTTVRQEIRKMRFEETWNEWKKGRLTQKEAGRILGMSERTFRRYLRRVVDNDNCVSFEGQTLQIPSDRWVAFPLPWTRKLSDYPFEKPELQKTKKEPRAKAPSKGTVLCYHGVRKWPTE
ncbi:MAG: hypothetical protein ACYCTV_07205 [Leptospirales bacterium]